MPETNIILTADLDADRVAVLDLLKGVAAAVQARDASAIARHFAPGAPIADLAPPLLRQGFDTDGVQAWLDGWDGAVETETRDMAIRISGDLAIVHGLQKTTASRGGQPVDWWSRLTLALERGDDGWRIIHFHDSVPFHMDGSFRAALDLKP